MTNERTTHVAALARAALARHGGAAGVAGARRTAPASAAAGDAARGKQLYYAHGCYGCHGYTGETGAQKLVGPKAPIVADVDTFMRFLRLRADYAPTVPAERMPNYSKAVAERRATRATSTRTFARSSSMRRTSRTCRRSRRS